MSVANINLYMYCLALDKLPHGALQELVTSVENEAHIASVLTNQQKYPNHLFYSVGMPEISDSLVVFGPSSELKSLYP